MRKAITPSLASVLLLATTISVRAENPQIAGIWRAMLHGPPCILMTVYDNEGELSGTMIFYLLKLRMALACQEWPPPSIPFITA
jgi:hypothetical protein